MTGQSVVVLKESLVNRQQVLLKVRKGVESQGGIPGEIGYKAGVLLIYKKLIKRSKKKDFPETEKAYCV